MAIVIEYINRAYGAVPVRYNSSNLCVGRSFKNTCIVDEPHVSPQHLLITQDSDGFRVKDMNSMNGFSVNQKRYKSGEAAHIRSGDMIMIGKVKIKVFRENHTPASTRLMGQWERALSGVAFQTLVYGSLALFILISMLETELFTVAPIDITSFIKDSFWLGGIGLAWLGFWWMMNRLVKGETRLLTHLATFTLSFLVGTFVSLFLSLLQFNVPDSTLINSAIASWGTAWLAGTVYIHICIVCHTALTKARVLEFIIVLSIIFFGGGLIDDEPEENDEYNRVELQGGMLPEPFLFRTSDTMSEFILDAKALNEALNEPLEESKE